MAVAPWLGESPGSFQLTDPVSPDNGGIRSGYPREAILVSVGNLEQIGLTLQNGTWLGQAGLSTLLRRHESAHNVETVKCCVVGDIPQPGPTLAAPQIPRKKLVRAIALAAAVATVG